MCVSLLAVAKKTPNSQTFILTRPVGLWMGVCICDQQSMHMRYIGESGCGAFYVCLTCMCPCVVWEGEMCVLESLLAGLEALTELDTSCVQLSKCLAWEILPLLPPH